MFTKSVVSTSALTSTLTMGMAGGSRSELTARNKTSLADAGAGDMNFGWSSIGRKSEGDVFEDLDNCGLFPSYLWVA